VWGGERAPRTAPAQILSRSVRIHEMAGEELGEKLHEEVVAYRQYTLQEVDLLAMATGFKVRPPGGAGDQGRRRGVGCEGFPPWQQAAQPAPPRVLAWLQVVGVYGDLRIDVDDLSHEDAYRLVVVLQRAPL
jgi:hypothetical protein